METKLKDVIHLYLGCEMQTEKGNKFTLQPSHFPNNWKNEYIFKYAKPILRPLSDVTDEEDKEFSKLYFDLMENQSFGMRDITVMAGMTKAYLEKGFDLFGLIESCQAIKKL